MRFRFFALLIMMQGIWSVSTLAQSATYSYQTHLVQYDNFTISDPSIQSLHNYFDSTQEPDETLLELLYGDNYRQDLPDWYQAINPGDYSITPVQIVSTANGALYEFILSGLGIEDFSGDIKVVRYRSGNDWVNDILSFDGDNVGAQFSETAISTTIDRDSIKVIAETHQPSPGVLYYANASLDPGLTAHSETSEVYHYAVLEDRIAFVRRERSQAWRFEATENLEQLLEAENNAQQYVNEVLNFDEIDEDIRYTLIKAIVKEQNVRKPDASPLEGIGYIKGDQIWVRDAPTDGEVVMKLDEGELCLLVEKGSYEAIRDMSGHWYLINHEGNTGWVYGAQLQLPPSETIEPTETAPAKEEAEEAEEMQEQEEVTPTQDDSKDMSDSDLLIVLVFGGLIASTVFGVIFFLIRFYVKSMRKRRKKQIDVSQFNPEADFSQDSAMKAEMERIVERFEFERQEAYKKYKNAFWGSVRNIFLFLLTGEGLVVGYKVYQAQSLDVISLSGVLVPMIAFIIMAFFFGGIYWILRGGRIFLDYATAFKRKLVEPVLKALNPQLQFKEEGLAKEAYFNAGIFRDQEGRARFESQDSVYKEAKGRVVMMISEVDHRNLVTMNKKDPMYYKKQEDLASGSRIKNDLYFEVFKGFFSWIELKAVNVQEAVKVLPAEKAEYHQKEKMQALYQEVIKWNPIKDIETLRQYVALESLELNDRRDDGNYLGGKYQVYAREASDAELVFGENFQKLMRYLMQKFGEDKVYVSLKENRLYVGLNIDKDLFQPEAAMKQPLPESGVVERIYQDLTFIRQLARELEAFQLTLN